MLNNIFKITGCFFLILVLCCVSSVIIILFRPAVIWDRVTEAVADDSIVVDQNERSIGEVTNSLNNQITGVGENVITLSESDLNTLIKARAGNENIFIDLHQGSARILYRLDSIPINAYVNVDIANTKISIKETGIGKIQFPGFISSIVNSMLARMASEIKLDSLLFELQQGVMIKAIALKDSEVTILIDFDPQIF